MKCSSGLDDDLRVAASEKYIELYELFTGKEFVFPEEGDSGSRIKRCLEGLTLREKYEEDTNSFSISCPLFVKKNLDFTDDEAASNECWGRKAKHCDQRSSGENCSCKKDQEV